MKKEHETAGSPFEVYRIPGDHVSPEDRQEHVLQLTEDEVERTVELEREIIESELGDKFNYSATHFVEAPGRTDLFGCSFTVTPKHDGTVQLVYTIMPTGEATYTIENVDEVGSKKENIFSDYHKAIEFFRSSL